MPPAALREARPRSKRSRGSSTSPHCWIAGCAISRAAKKAGSRWPARWHRRPDFLLLDEPFAALDGARRRAFIQVLIHMHRAWRLPMLVVTHNIDDAAALGSHLVALKEGRVVAAGEFAASQPRPQNSRRCSTATIPAPPCALRTASMAATGCGPIRS